MTFSFLFQTNIAGGQTQGSWNHNQNWKALLVGKGYNLMEHDELIRLGVFKNVSIQKEKKIRLPKNLNFTLKV